MKRTRLYSSHKRLGARMIEFFGWEMPLEFKGIIEEHLAVRERAGLFDVSHMGEIIVRGKRPLDFLQYLTPNDVSRLEPNRAQYSALITSKGTFVDDILVYNLGGEEYLLVTNAANTEKDFAWILSHAKNFEVEVVNKSDDYTQIALQGPKSQQILQPLTTINLEEMRPFWSARGKIEGEEVMISRTGYTGEDGFEIYTLSPHPELIWEAILKRGESFGLLPAGLGARDTLRLEAKLMLYGNDIDETTSILEAGLGWMVKFEKSDFLGKEALLNQKKEGIKRKLVGFEIISRGIARPHYPVFIEGKKVSEVTSGSYSPYLKKSIGLVYLPLEYSAPGTEFEIGVRERRLKARVVPTPFYKRKNGK